MIDNNFTTYKYLQKEKGNQSSLFKDFRGIMFTMTVLTNSTPYSHPQYKDSDYCLHYQTFFSFFLLYTFFEPTTRTTFFLRTICAMCPFVIPCFQSLFSMSVCLLYKYTTYTDKYKTNYQIFSNFI